LIYVMSDIHGNMARFDSILKQINLQPTDELYILGDVIDRYPDGIKILRRVMAMPNAHMLLGNHEYMMMNAIAPKEIFTDGLWSPYPSGRNLSIWYRNGGRVTHEYLKHIRKTARQEIFAFIYNLPLEFDLKVNGRAFKLVHGSPLDQFDNWCLEEHRDERHFAVWNRPYKYDPDPEGYTLIFGHTPTYQFQGDGLLNIWHSKTGGRIDIDCGSGFPKPEPWDPDACFGRLACLRLDDMKEFYSDDGGFADAQQAKDSEN